MKTPKREYYFYDSGINPENGDIIMDMLTPGIYEARWKRKNKISQYKRTIARLTQELRYEREYSRCFLAAYNRLARIVRNAKQGNLLCTDAEQLSERKGN